MPFKLQVCLEVAQLKQLREDVIRRHLYLDLETIHLLLDNDHHRNANYALQHIKTKHLSCYDHRLYRIIPGPTVEDNDSVQEILDATSSWDISVIC